MNMELPRGVQDILPEDIPYWQLVENTARKLLNLITMKK